MINEGGDNSECIGAVPDDAGIISSPPLGATSPASGKEPAKTTAFESVYGYFEFNRGRREPTLLAPPRPGRQHAQAGTGLIHEEPAWRRPEILDHGDIPPLHAVASQWADLRARPDEKIAMPARTHYTLGLALSNTSMAISIGGQAVHDGLVVPGMIQMTGPGQPVRGLFRAPSQFLHLHIGSRFLANCYEEISERAPPREIVFEAGFSRDATMEQLGRSLLCADAPARGLGTLYADSICLAIVARLLDLHLRDRLASGSAPIAGLAKWRLKRVVDYVEAHLATPITLTDLAGSSGLSRMHFAAQFRAATGLRPHEYVLRRRIERSQDLLLNHNMSVLDAASRVGFQNQAHFTTVFKRFCGDTPYQWRLARRGFCQK